MEKLSKKFFKKLKKSPFKRGDIVIGYGVSNYILATHPMIVKCKYLGVYDKIPSLSIVEIIGSGGAPAVVHWKQLRRIKKTKLQKLKESANQQP